ncbi:MAG: hypothetical protein U5L72_08560 [Bacteroidales bacterium]|nr:hypothetical protein [Bacteroidales bacterium]
MKRKIIITILAIAVLTACGTTKKSGQTSVTDSEAAAAAAAATAAAAAAETLAAIPCRCDSVMDTSPWVRFLRLPEPVTNQPQFDILCKSEYPATVSINGIEVKQYKTGIFFSTVKFNEGVNIVRAEAIYPDGRTAVCEQAFIYEKRDMTRQTYPLWVDSRSFQPYADMELLPDEVVSVKINASRGNRKRYV